MARIQFRTGALALLLALGGCSGGEAESGGPPAPPVTVAAPVVREVVDSDEFIGRFEAVQHVDVRPRASGYLTSVHFQDGQYVRRGQLLFTIDSRSARAAQAQAGAELSRAQAALENARTELARSRSLAEAQAASQEEVESREAAVRSAEAQVAAAQASARARSLDVGFTRVTAPISGRISERNVDVGNAVQADQTVLTTIVSVDPLHFAFEGSEALLLKYQREGAGIDEGAAVRIRLQDEADFVHAGTLDYVGSTIDPGAGTVRARAVVPNPEGLLKPGMIGNLRLASSQPYRALLVPETAVMSDAARRVVYVVTEDNTLTARPVEPGPLMGDLRVIRSGLSAGDRVVIGGAQRARPGQKVEPKAGTIPPSQTGGDGEPAPPQPRADASRPAADR
ncbi:efflux RND transporter periplasmic adaptor subunit [Sphingosinithalassobacter sp. CS137]|uniref:efflux RND transporter periplasmic adaptor subunit n=1 Tax=Sphingosinithalassobacter sp. CS137 TaxID=2762748 RepID=UPI00165E7828|nr:efflux RND transporter periplasmic adaptor subunit [Sphingosinithalassobacter sp. CS137]